MGRGAKVSELNKHVGWEGRRNEKGVLCLGLDEHVGREKEEGKRERRNEEKRRR